LFFNLKISLYFLAFVLNRQPLSQATGRYQQPHDMADNNNIIKQKVSIANNPAHPHSPKSLFLAFILA
jgi:hypothetical protein